MLQLLATLRHAWTALLSASAFELSHSSTGNWDSDAEEKEQQIEKSSARRVNHLANTAAGQSSIATVALANCHGNASVA